MIIVLIIVMFIFVFMFIISLSGLVIVVLIAIVIVIVMVIVLLLDIDIVILISHRPCRARFFERVTFREIRNIFDSCVIRRCLHRSGVAPLEVHRRSVVRRLRCAVGWRCAS